MQKQADVEKVWYPNGGVGYRIAERAQRRMRILMVGMLTEVDEIVDTLQWVIYRQFTHD